MKITDELRQVMARALLRHAYVRGADTDAIIAAVAPLIAQEAAKEIAELKAALGNMIATLRLTGNGRDEKCNRSVIADDLEEILGKVVG